jgi:hypothetical protein
MKKIGLLCLALVLALGTLGVGFAHWSQEIVINQEVTTGEVKVGVFGVATDPAEVEDKDICTVTVTNGYISAGIGGPVIPGNNGAIKFRKDLPDGSIASALYPAGTYDFFPSTTIAIDSYYPSLYILEDFVITNGGTIPVKLDVTLTVTDPDGVYDHLDLTAVRVWKESGGVWEELYVSSGKANVELPKLEVALEGIQLEGCETILIWMDKHLQQEAPQGKRASMTLTVDAVQWNLYMPPA